MKHLNSLITLLFCFSLCGCAAPRAQESKKISPVEKKALMAAELAKDGKNAGLITLSHRKLGIDEVAKHLDMDHETAEEHLKTTNVHGYFSLIAKNYPPGTEFILYHVDLSRTVRPTKSFFVNGNGTLVTQLDDLFINLENNYLFFSNYLPGEPADFVLGSKDQTYFSATRIVPNAIEAEDEEGRTLSVQLDDPDKRHYRVHCTGLEPFDAYMLITEFENERLAHAVSANQNGEVFLPTGPTVPWVTGGEGAVELRGSSLRRPLVVHFNWGEM